MNKIDTHISLKVFQAIDVTVLKVIFKMCLVHIICMPYITIDGLVGFYQLIMAKKPFNKVIFICFNESRLKIMKGAFKSYLHSGDIIFILS